jgi:hypothetical protein
MKQTTTAFALCLVLVLTQLTGSSQCNTVFYDDFESGLFMSPPWIPGTGHVITVTTSPAPAQGNYALYLSGTNGSHYTGPQGTFTPSQPTYISWRVRCSFTSGANNYVVIGDASTTSNNGIVFSYFNGGDLRFYNNTQWNYAITMNTWYHVEMRNINWTSKTFDLWINGVLWQAGFAFRSTSSTNVDRVFLYNLTSPGSPGAGYDVIQIGDPPPVSAVVATPVAVCAGSSVTLTAIGTATAFTWSGGVTNGAGFTPTGTTVYTVSATAQSGTTSCSNSITHTLTVHPNPTVTAVSNQTAICAGSSAVLTATGAATYTWSTNSTNQSINVSPTVTTTYTVTGKSSVGCTGTANVATVNQPVKPNPTVMVSASPATICAGESATITATGADTYTWNTNVQTPTIAVTLTTTTFYGVTGSNSLGCTASTVVAVNVNPLPVLSITSSTNNACEGAQVVLTASGGQGYQWSGGGTGNTNTINPTVSGPHFVSGTSSLNCANSASILITVQPGPQLSVTPSSPTLCTGQSVLLQASGTAISYLWDNTHQFSAYTVTPSINTTYTVTGIAPNTCKRTIAVTVTVHATPVVGVSADRPRICKGETAVLTATGAPAYAWTGPGTNSSVASSVALSPVVNASFVVTGTSPQGCTAKAAITVTVSSCNGLDEFTPGQPVLIFPNPSSGAFTVKAGTAMDLALINSCGQLIREFSLNENAGHTFVIDGLPAGIYFITGNAGMSPAKIVVSR